MHAVLFCFFFIFWILWKVFWLLKFDFVKGIKGKYGEYWICYFFGKVIFLTKWIILWRKIGGNSKLYKTLRLPRYFSDTLCTSMNCICHLGDLKELYSLSRTWLSFLLSFNIELNDHSTSKSSQITPISFHRFLAISGMTTYFGLSELLKQFMLARTEWNHWYCRLTHSQIIQYYSIDFSDYFWHDKPPLDDLNIWNHFCWYVHYEIFVLQR